MNAPTLAAVRGTTDLLGQECRVHQHLVSSLKKCAERFSFQPLATPLMEYAAVFKRTLGDTSDIVTKEMYTFPDRNDELLTLRPEGTAGIARAFIENRWYDKAPFKVYYHGAMFRYERPQKGRQRQFHQVGIEILGVPDPMADAEALALAWQWLQALKLENVPYQLEINSLGDRESRDAYRSVLTTYLREHEAGLSDDSKARLGRNPLRILDSKDEQDKAIIAGAPKLHDSLNEPSRAFFATVTALLEKLGIPFVHNPALVRGLDYYSHTAFEITSTALGAQSTLLAGGRYDTLIETMGGRPTAGIGWAAGLERLALLVSAPPEPPATVAVIPMGEEQQQAAFLLAQTLRGQGVAVDFAYSGNAGKRLKKAASAGIPLAVLLGDAEITAGTVTVRNLGSGEQETVPTPALAGYLQR